jgi:putative salt-induced outer membrane protein
MKKQSLISLLFGLSLLNAPLAFAQTDSETATIVDESTTVTPEQKNLTGSTQFGGLVSTGDTEAYTINTAVNLAYTKEKWTNTGGLTAIYDDDKTGDSLREYYEVEGQTQYNYTEKRYAFLQTDYVKDTDQGYDYVWNTNAGYGRTFYKNEKYHMTLDGQLGPGYRIAPSNDNAIQDQQITGNGSLIYNWQITKTTAFAQTANVSYAKSDTISQANSSITTKFYQQFGIQFAFNLTHHTNVPDDASKTNTLTTVSLTYDF